MIYQSISRAATEDVCSRRAGIIEQWFQSPNQIPDAGMALLLTIRRDVQGRPC